MHTQTHPQACCTPRTLSYGQATEDACQCHPSVPQGVERNPVALQGCHDVENGHGDRPAHMGSCSTAAFVCVHVLIYVCVCVRACVYVSVRLYVCLSVHVCLCV
jgi:hypothetical protein